MKGKITLDKIFKLGILLVILLAGFSIFYYFVIFLPQKEEAKLELQKEASLREALIEQQKLDLQQEEQENAKKELTTQRALLNYCLNTAEESGKNALEAVCPSGTCKEGTDISFFQTLDQYIKEMKAECYKKYPQK